MSYHWLTTVRSLLRGLGCAKRHANIAKPDKFQLELLNITIQHTYNISGLENICVVENFLSDDLRQRERDFMAILFRSKMSADFCSKYVSSTLFGWIAEDMSELIVDSVRIKRKPILRIPNDTYTDGVRAEMTALFRQQTERKHVYTSLVIRKEHESGTLITSAELYALFSTTVKQMRRQPLIDSVEVRILAVYSQWVQIITAKTTQSYITSILEGQSNIADEMEISQTPWFDFLSISGQHCVLLAVFESIRMQSSDVKAQIPFNDIKLQERHSKSLKRKISTTQEYGNKKKR
ncbi:hypothetical protein EAF04_008400 [Stromatinia cepivora]|nr:hypothetical protein EAF04_008400 [Stromatinia cepivora]